MSRLGRRLHAQRDHPLCTIKERVYSFFQKGFAYKRRDGTPFTTPAFALHDDLDPVVSTEACFDQVLVPKDHISRQPADTYYVNESTVLRTHTSAHQTELLRRGERAFLACGDVYRRDSIDATHYPVFHQMEGLRVMEEGGATHEDARHELYRALEGMVDYVFEGKVTDYRWIDTTFPFTHPSWEMEILYQGQWLEVLGCGVTHPGVLRNAHPSLERKPAWAFGIGLERIAMVLFKIPDIRLFWSDDARFLSQFKQGEITTFVPYSKMPPCTKDISFWVSPEFHYNSLCDIVRNVAGDLVESVEKVDEFENSKTRRVSQCYRVTYRAMDRTLTNSEVDELQEQVRQQVAGTLRVELR